MAKDQLSKWVESRIVEFTKDSKKNRLNDYSDPKIWDEPLIGFSRGDDPLYQFLKEDIGDFYWTPMEIFQLHYPKSNVKAEELTIISWVLPQTEKTKAVQRLESRYPSENWARAKFFGEKFNDLLRDYVVQCLSVKGFAAIAPLRSNYYKNMESKKYGYAANWSERHTAFISGLGTFGLSDGLITKVGKAMRCGSVVANLKIEPTKRLYQNHSEYCLYYSLGTCLKCVERCPAGAISEKGHDKKKCREYQNQVIKKYIKSEYNLDSSSCGLCQTAIPCESRIPV